MGKRSAASGNHTKECLRDTGNVAAVGNVAVRSFFGCQMGHCIEWGMLGRSV